MRKKTTLRATKWVALVRFLVWCEIITYQKTRLGVHALIPKSAVRIDFQSLAPRRLPCFRIICRFIFSSIIPVDGLVPGSRVLGRLKLLAMKGLSRALQFACFSWDVMTKASVFGQLDKSIRTVLFATLWYILKTSTYDRNGDQCPIRDHIFCITDTSSAPGIGVSTISIWSISSSH